MTVLGWIALGLATAILASGFRRGEEQRTVLAARYVAGMAGALLGGLVATAAGVGPIADFFHTGTWLIAAGGAIIALVALELARGSRERRGVAPRGSADWAGADAARGGYGPDAASEGQTLDRNW